MFACMLALIWTRHATTYGGILKWLHSYLKMIKLLQHPGMSLSTVKMEEFKESTNVMLHMILYTLFCAFEEQNKDGPIIYSHWC